MSALVFEIDRRFRFVHARIIVWSPLEQIVNKNKMKLNYN